MIKVGGPVQDSSAQLVSHLLDPQPGEFIIDACAAPGGKTTHIAELMQDTGKILALDKVKSRLKKLQQNIDRLELGSLEIKAVDVSKCSDYYQVADKVLLDAPCSGLGTLHRRADARWRQTLENIQTLSKLQSELLAKVAQWVKPGGCLVYATCTLHPQENEVVIQSFLRQHSNWRIEQPPEVFQPGNNLKAGLKYGRNVIIWMVFLWLSYLRANFRITALIKFNQLWLSLKRGEIC
jgi:16S rRNA (cytosine967-C5)-methyltransferase